jgi:hypothetical protein
MSPLNLHLHQPTISQNRELKATFNIGSTASLKGFLKHAETGSWFYLAVAAIFRVAAK